MLKEIRVELGRCTAVVQQRLRLIESDLKSLQWIVQCPVCLQLAMNADGETVNCFFCYYSPELLKAAEEYVMNVLGYPGRFSVEKGGGQWPVRTCPECGCDTLIAPIRGEAHNFYCFTCGADYGLNELEPCHNCGEFYPHDGHTEFYSYLGCSMRE